ncbi:hypothetical protein ALQ35_200024 [Pseudomonas fluorescens]|nr:hypothetical protein ALQ35_200024 [Pseudomonas fluorescens]
MAIDSDKFPLGSNFSYAVSQYVCLAAQQVFDATSLKIRPIDFDNFLVKSSINEVVVTQALPACFFDVGLIFKSFRD